MKQLFFAIFLGIIITCTGCSSKNPQPVTVSDFLFNTYVSITVYDSNEAAIVADALELCRRYELIFSRTHPDSALYELNNKQHITAADPELFELIKTGLFYCKSTNGALDISVEPLTSLWNITAPNPVVPSVSQIESALTQVNYNNILLNEDDLSITLNHNAAIDLGAIAKGYIADQIKEFLVANGVTSGLIDLGGNILCIGTRPDGANYSIGVKEPLPEHSGVLLTLSINDMSVVTSGTYERFFVKDDTTYHHIINPATGYPANSGLCSITIISRDSVVGDCLSTACLVMGIDASLELLNSMDNVYGILIDNNMKIYYSDGAENLLR